MALCRTSSRHGRIQHCEIDSDRLVGVNVTSNAPLRSVAATIGRWTCLYISIRVALLDLSCARVENLKTSLLQQICPSIRPWPETITEWKSPPGAIAPTTIVSPLTTNASKVTQSPLAATEWNRTGLTDTNLLASPRKAQPLLRIGENVKSFHATAPAASRR